MKSNLRRICCLLLALAMIFSVAACGKATDSGSALDFEDEGWDIDAGNTDVDASTDEGDKTQTGNTSTVNSQGGGTGTVKQPAVKNADSLSLAELTAQIPSKLRGTTVHVFSWNPVKDVTGAEKVVDSFEKKTGIKVKWEQGSYDNYDESIVAKINSGAAPDIIRYNEPNPGRMSMCQDVKTATGFDFAGDIWDSSIRDAFTIKGKTYAVNMKNSFNKQPTVVVYLKSTVENNQLEDPYQLWKQGKWTFDKFIEMCKQFKSETGSAGWMTSRLIDIMWFEHLSFINFDGKTYTNNSTSPEIIKMLQRVCDWRAEGVMSGGASETSQFTAGNYLFYTTNILGLRRNDSQHFVEQKKNNDIYCVPFPAQTGKAYWQSNQESESFGIPKGAKNPEAVYYFLRYYADRENYDEKMFFSNSQILEVYDWCISQPNQHYTFDRKITAAYGEELCDITVDIRGGLQAAQVETKLQSLSPQFQHATNEANKVVAKF